MNKLFYLTDKQHDLLDEFADHFNNVFTKDESEFLNRIARMNTSISTICTCMRYQSRGNKL